MTARAIQIPRPQLGQLPRGHATGDTAAVAAEIREQDWTTLRGYDRAVVDGWLTRFETDGHGGLVEVREKYVGNYGLTKRQWTRVRKPEPKRDGVTLGNLQRSSSRFGLSQRLLSYLARTGPHGARYKQIASQLETSENNACHVANALARRGFVRIERQRQPAGKRRTVAVCFSTDSWRDYLPWALTQMVASKALTATDCAGLLGIGYENIGTALAELARADLVGRLRTDVGYIYFRNGATPDGDT